MLPVHILCFSQVKKIASLVCFDKYNFSLSLLELIMLGFQVTLCIQEVCQVLHHHIGVAPHLPPWGPLIVCMEILGWCPLMHPWSLLHLLEFLRTCHLCMATYLSQGTFATLLYTPSVPKSKIILTFRKSIWNKFQIQYWYDSLQVYLKLTLKNSIMVLDFGTEGVYVICCVLY